MSTRESEPTRRHLPLIQDGSPADSVRVEFPNGKGFSLDRRDFLRLSAVGTAAAGLASAAAGCAPQREEILPRPVRPEEARVGLALHYATNCFGCPAGCGLVAKAREGRVIKVEGNASHPINRGALCSRGQASVLELYDGDRLRKSVQVSRGKTATIEMSNDAVDQAIAKALQKARGSSKVRLLTGVITGPAMRNLVDEFLSSFPGSRHVVWEPLGVLTQNVMEAQGRSYGERVLPQYHVDRAELIVSFGGDVLDTWLSPMQFAKDWASRRDPDDTREMSRLWVFEGRMSLTGSNADKRFRVRPSRLADVALALVHEIIAVRKFGALASDSAIVDALQGRGIDAMASRIGMPADELRKVAAALIAKAGASLVVAGGPASTDASSGLLLETAVNLLNSALGNDGVTVDARQVSHQSAGSHGELALLVDEMRAGKVDVLLVWGTNPVYAAPPVLGFAEAMSHVGFVTTVADRLDETSLHADIVCAGAQPLESWADVEPIAGVVSISQPAMLPIGEMRSLSDVLVVWGAIGGGKDSLLAVRKMAQADEKVPSAGYHYIRNKWKIDIYPRLAGAADFETFWVELLHTGVVVLDRDSAAANPPRTFRALALREAMREGAKDAEIEVVLFASHGMYDGRMGNNGWLFEVPDPITRITWDSWVSLSPKRMRALELSNGDYCEVTAAGTTLRLPAFEQAGQHDDVIAIPLGYGRSAAGLVGNGVGVNAFELTAMGPFGPQFSGHGAKLVKAKGATVLAIPQGEAIIDLNERPLIPLTTLTAFKKNAGAGAEAPGQGPSIWPALKYPETRWGMAIDLSKCIGCGACTVACQAENNIPTAGRKGVIAGREMHWIRVDRYFAAPVPRTAESPEAKQKIAQAREEMKSGQWLDAPEIVYQPLMCQHCDNAPCETVCPVGATNHSAEGLNVQAYNRCVGTRYCSNNCPFKARRFNWFDYSQDRNSWFTRIFQPEVPKLANMNARWPLPLKNNPEVTVRSRGVMEKCTFCVQRIAEGRGKAKDEKRGMKDGDIVPACQQTCPTQAIRFGNMVDETSEVARLRKSKRGLTMLNDQNVGASVTYLSKVRNDEV